MLKFRALGINLVIIKDSEMSKLRINFLTYALSSDLIEL